MDKQSLLIVSASSEERAEILEQIHRSLDGEYRVAEARTLAGALATVQSERLTCAVIGESPDAEIALDFLRAQSEGPDPTSFPVVVLAGASSSDTQTAIAVMKAGASDYLTGSKDKAEAIGAAVREAVSAHEHERKERVRFAERERHLGETLAHNENLRAANAAKDDFLALLSHELRTPLMPVLSIVSSTLRDTQLPPDLRETFALIQRNIALEARLIDDLLDLTQIATGWLKMEKSPVDVHGCIGAALEICRESFAEKLIVVREDLAATDATVSGEFARLNQVLWNLLKNAVKFTRPNGTVLISTRNEESNLVVEVRDDGVGIDPQLLPTLFGAFHSGRPNPTRTGIGMGLAIAQAIVQGHGGEIEAESEGIDRGATFRITLPTSESLAPSGLSLHEVSDTGGRGRTILVVEDHEDTRRVLSRALRRRGFGVAVADSISSASERFATNRPDLVLCDLGLPDGTGWELMQRLRSDGPVRAIAMSGYGMEHDIQKSRDSGFLAHLTKPIDFAALEIAISGAFEQE